MEVGKRALENLGVSDSHWRGRRVLVTGHTGFKGAWLCLWLVQRGARVTGFALPPTRPSLFELARVWEDVAHVEGDLRQPAALRRAFAAAEPEVVFHLAAQSLVRESYREPVATYQINVGGTVAVLEACRHGAVRAVIVVTSDKCYRNVGSSAPFRESDPLGGDDPYSSSKAAAELATAAYRQSFFATSGPAVATARAGNVIGGGDFAPERLIPDIVRAYLASQQLSLRNPGAVRPWQHVLEPLSGYLMLAERLLGGDRSTARAWNFGPGPEDAKRVSWIAERAQLLLANRQPWINQPDIAYPEAETLHLDSRDAREMLGWRPRLGVESALNWAMEWYQAWRAGADVRGITLAQLDRYAALAPLSA